MIKLSKLTTYLNDYVYFDKSLNLEKIDPFMTNGMLIKGKEDVSKIGFSVSASVKLFQLAMQKSCDAVIVHHSLNFPPYNRYDQIFQGRIEYLLKNDLSLFGFHFLLDAHPEIGNNVEIINILKAKKTKQYVHRGNPWGWIGEFEKPEMLQSIQEKMKVKGLENTVTYDFGPREIKKVAAVSGKGAPTPANMQYLLDNNIDLFITGEVHEWNRELFREARINFIAAGHYRSEILGVKNLMTIVKTKFPNVDTEWLDLFNEI